MLNSARDTPEWIRVVERRLGAAERNSGKVAQSVVERELAPIKSDLGQLAQYVAAAPVEITTQTSTYRNMDGRQRARVVVDFPDVTRAVDETPILVTSYEMEGVFEEGETTNSAYPALALPGLSYPGSTGFGLTETQNPPGMQRMAVSGTSGFRIDDLEPGRILRLRVRALAGDRVLPGIWSRELLVVLTVDTTPPPQPTAPILTVSRGTITATWDGQSVIGAMPADTKYAILAVDAASSPTAEMYRFGPNGGFTVLADLEYYTNYFFRVQAFDESGNASPWSEQAIAYVEPLVNEDVILSVIDAAETQIKNAGQLVLESGQQLTEKLLISDQQQEAAASAVDQLRNVTLPALAEDLAGSVSRLTAAEGELTRAFGEIDLVPGKILTAQQEAVQAAAQDATEKANAAADEAAALAISAQGYILNPSFDDWTGGTPAGYGPYVGPVTKETTLFRRGPFSVRFDCTDATSNRGLNLSSGAIRHAPNLEYWTVEMTFQLVSGTSLSGAGLLLDWVGLTTGSRASLNLGQEIPTPVTGKWYTVTKTLRRPTNSAGTWTAMSGYLMANYAGFAGMGPMAVKDIVFDWVDVRPATNEEIAAYGAPALIDAKADVLIQSAEPVVAMRKPTTLWIDTTNTANTPKRWSGSAWVAVTDEVARNAAAAAVLAQERADDAHELAGFAQDAADDAMTAANGVSKNLFDTGTPVGVAPYGSTWFQVDGTGTVIGQWQQTAPGIASTWTPRQVGSAVIANLDVGKLVAGTAVVNNLVAQKIAASTASFQQVDAKNLFVTGTASLSSVVAQRLAAETGVFMSLTTGQLTAGTASISEAVINKLYSEVVMSRKILAEQILLGDMGNRLPDPLFKDAQMNARRNTNSTMTVTPTAAGLDVTMPGIGNYYFRPTGVTQTVAAAPDWMKVLPGEVWTLEVTTTALPGTSNDIRATFRTQDGSTVVTPGVSPTTFAAPGTALHTVTVPAGAYLMLPEVRFSGAVGTAAVPAGGVVIKQLIDNRLIVDGGVTARNITASEQLTAKVAQFLKVTAGQIDANSIWADSIFVGLADAKIVRADMFTGKSFTGGTFTGSIFQTTTTAFAGVQFDSVGVRAFEPGTGSETFRVDAATGNVTASKGTFTGVLWQSETAANRGIKISSTGIRAYDPTGRLMVNLKTDGTTNTLVGNFGTNLGTNRQVRIENSSNFDEPVIFILRDGWSNPGDESAIYPLANNDLVIRSAKTDDAPNASRVRAVGRFTVYDRTLGVHGLEVTYYPDTSRYRVNVGWPAIATLSVSGDLFVQGNKAFRITHPTLPGRDLVHVATESPLPGVEYWGEGVVPPQGRAVVELPSYFDALTEAVGRVVFVSAQGAATWTAIADGKFTVTAKSGTAFSWLVKATRKGAEFEVEPPTDTLEEREPNLTPEEIVEKYRQPRAKDKLDARGLVRDVIDTRVPPHPGSGPSANKGTK